MTEEAFCAWWNLVIRREKTEKVQLLKRMGVDDCRGSQLSVLAGESFERVIAYMLNTAGFVVHQEQPYRIRLRGQDVGDLDVVAFDPRSDNAMVAVNCKGWSEGEPGAKDFNHFVSNMEMANVRHGIVFWRNIPRSIYPLVEYFEKKGYRIALIDKEVYEQLHQHMLNGRADLIGDHVREKLGLAGAGTTTLGTEITLRKARLPRRSVKCWNLLPRHYGPDPPNYVKNAYFQPSNARLILRPYFLAIFHAYREARMPGTGELLGEINRTIDMICDGVTGRYVSPDDHVFQVVRNHYADALKEEAIDEEDFVVDKFDFKIDRRAMIRKMQVDASRSIEPISAEWTDSSGQEHERLIRASPNDLREETSWVVYVPVWQISYQLSNYLYVREFFATDGSVIRDDMRLCGRCKEQQTIAVCSKCGSTVCNTHAASCKTCGQIFCDMDSLKCVKCSTTYCKTHALGAFCAQCGVFTDTSCIVRCTICDGSVCPVHTSVCVECGKTVCPKHVIQKRYMLVKKQFCSESCREKYELQYRQKGVLGKIKRVAKK